MSGLLSIGRSAISSYGAALETVSQNIANAENGDYVRRDVVLGDATISGSLNPLYSAQSGLSGVRINGVARSGDEFLEASVRLSGAALVRTETQANWLSAIETGLDSGGEHVGKRLAAFYSRGQELAAAPFDSALRVTFINEINATAETFRRTGDNLELSIEQIGLKADAELLGINEALSSLSRVNLDLRRSTPGSQAQAGLLDTRDVALAVITERLDAKIEFGANGVAKVSYNGETIVEIGNSATLSMEDKPDGSFNILVNGASGKVPGNGMLAGLSRARTAATTDLTNLNKLAEDFATQLNDWHAGGLTDAGTAGVPLLTTGGGASGLNLQPIGAAQLALASTGGVPNGNLLELDGLRSSGNIERDWNQIISVHANLILATKNEQASASALDRNARSNRDSLSRVDLDRETADLIRLQQSYEAAGRVIQMARETTQTILGLF